MLNKEFLASVARHLLTKGAGALVAYGVIQKDQSTAFVEIGAGIAVFGAGLVWSWIEKKRKAKAQAAAVAMVATPAAGTTPQ